MAERGGKTFHKIDEVRAQNQRFESEGPEFMIFKEYDDDDDDDDDDEDEMLMKSFSSKGRHCCCIGSLSKPSRALLGPSCSSSSSPCDWEKKIQSTAEINNKRRWWTRPLRNIRQIVAVPKLKALIRRFRRNSGGCDGGGCGGGRSGGGSGKFQYDPSSYYLNFDESSGRNSHFKEEYGNFPDFSSRFAHIPHQTYNKSSHTDMGKFGISSPA